MKAGKGPYDALRNEAHHSRKLMPNKALKPTRFRYAPAVGLALRWAIQTGEKSCSRANRQFWLV